MRNLPKIKFRPFPTTRLHYQDETIQKTEIRIEKGEVARFLTLPDYLANVVTVHLDEDPHGLPAAFFIVKSIGPHQSACGGYIGEHDGERVPDRILSIGFRNLTLCPIDVRGAIGIQPLEVVEEELARDHRATAWEEKKEHAFEAAMAHLPVLFAELARRDGVASSSSAASQIRRLVDLVRELRPDQMQTILATFEDDQQAHFMKILEEMMIFT